MMDKKEIEKLGDELYDAQRYQQTIAPLTERVPDITLDDAYRISLHVLGRRIDGDGEVVVGKKIGVTNKKVHRMLNVDHPIFGFITDKMVRQNSAHIRFSGQMIDPRIEGEIGFKLKKDLVGPNISERDVLKATECIIPCLEIIDSRIHNWENKIQDSVADNGCANLIVLGDTQVALHDIDLPSLEMKIYKNGKLIGEGLGSEVLGNPLTAVAWLANALCRLMIPLKAGEIILSGSLVSPETVAPGDYVNLELKKVGTVNCYTLR